MSESRKKEILACIGLIFVTVNWGLSFVFIKSSVDVMPPLYMLGIRFTIGGLLLALINRLGEWQARRRGAPPPLPLNLDCRHCTMCGKGKKEG